MIRKAMTSEQARKVRADGHKDAKEFALAIGLDNDYQNDHQAKKDVIDFNGDAHFVKSGKKKWQMFLYSRNRIDTDPSFKVMNGIGQIIVECLDVFPKDRGLYEANKQKYKDLLIPQMKKLKEKISDSKLEAFLYKSIFNNGEVQYLTIKNNDIFHIFYYQDVLNTMKTFDIQNSKARQKGQTDSQKVVFKQGGTTIGEIEIRNDSDIHYREIKFWLKKDKVVKLLCENIKLNKKMNKKVIVFGKAIKKMKI